MKTAIFLLILLFALPAQAGWSGDRAQCIQFHRDRDLEAAEECYARLIQRGDAEKDPDLYRLIGAAYALDGKRVEAYWNYDRYTKKCPQCMHAPSVRKIIKDYEEYNGGPPPEPKTEAKDDGRPSPISVKRCAKAKALLDKAHALKKVSPGQARGLVEDAAWLLPKGHPLWKRVRALRADLQGKGAKKSR